MQMSPLYMPDKLTCMRQILSACNANCGRITQLGAAHLASLMAVSPPSTPVFIGSTCIGQHTQHFKPFRPDARTLACEGAAEPEGYLVITAS